MLLREDRTTTTDKTYFFINTMDANITKYGICFNVNDLANKEAIEQDILNRTENIASLNCYR